MLKAAALVLAIAATATVAGAQGTTSNKSSAKPVQASATAKPKTHVKKKETQEQMQKEAKIAEATARETALARVPNGSVKSSELEREKGKLIYSYDITVPGKTGVEEVNVDAMTGKVIATEHESAKTEKKEAAKEAKKTAPKK
jgi:uncharacterized membrane protein YkoI